MKSIKGAFIGCAVASTMLLAACGSTGGVPAAPDKGSATAGGTPKVLLDVSGTGVKSTNKFTANGDWDLNWSYDCTNFGQSGNFAILIYGKDSNDPKGAGANELGTKGADVNHQHDAGTFYLEITSECAWHVMVKG